MEQVIINSIVLSMIFILIALGIALIFGVMGVLNFAHGQMYVIGGFIVSYLYGQYQLNFFLVLVICVLVLAAIGAAFDRFLFQRLARMARREESMMFLALGTALLLDSVLLMIFGEKSRGAPPVVGGLVQILGAILVLERLFVIGMSALLAAGLALFIKYSKFGMAIRAISQDKVAARLQGVDVDKISTVGFAMGAALAGVSGGLLVPVFMIHAGAGGAFTLKSFLMMLIGGFGSIPGAVVGGIVLGFLESFGYAFLPGTWTYFIIFCAVMFLLVLRPQGIMGR